MDMKNLPTRADALKTLIREKFNDNQSAFALAVGKSVAQINQYLNGVRNIGEKVAREIEVKLDLPIGYLDGKGEPLPISELSKFDKPKDVHAVPYLNVYASMGSGAIPPEFVKNKTLFYKIYSVCY